MTYIVGFISFFDNELKVGAIEASTWIEALYLYCKRAGIVVGYSYEDFLNITRYNEAVRVYNTEDSVIEHVKLMFFDMDMMFDVKKLN